LPKSAHKLLFVQWVSSCVLAPLSFRAPVQSTVPRESACNIRCTMKMSFKFQEIKNNQQLILLLSIWH